MRPRVGTARLDRRATRFLAGKAFDARALDPVSWEFIHDEPARASEVPEFTRWLAGDVDAEGER